MDFLIKRQNFIAGILSLLVIGCFYWVTLHYTVNMPVWDDYGAIVDFLIKNFDAKSSVEQVKLLFEKHAEHRVFYTRLAALFDYTIFGQVNFIRLVLIGNLGLLGIAVILFKSLKQDKNRWLFFLPVVLLLFQIQYWDLIICSTNSLQNINTVLFAFIALYFLNKNEPKYFYFALVFAFIATFSSGNGMFAFGAGLIILFYRKSSNLSKAIWILVMIISIVWYFHEFESNTPGLAGGYTHRSPGKALTQAIYSKPDQVMSFLFTFIGSSFIDLVRFKGGFLIVFLIGFSTVIYCLYLVQVKYYKNNPVFVAFLMFLILSGLALAMLRINSGVQYALSPRYHFFSLLFVIMVYLTMIEQFNLYRNKKYAYLSIVLSAAFYALVFPSNLEKLKEARERYIYGAKTYHQYRQVSWKNQDLNTALKEIHSSRQGLSLPAGKRSQVRRQAAAASLIQEAEKRNIFKLSYSSPEKKYPIRPLPRETDSLKHSIIIKENLEFIIVDDAWAFMVGENATRNQIYMVLQSDSNRYIVKTNPVKKHELINIYGPKYLDAGFKAKVSKMELEKGEYLVGLLIAERDSLKGFKLTKKKIRIDYIGDLPVNQLIMDKISIPEKSEGLNHTMKLEGDATSILVNNGWALVEGLNSKETQIFLVFQSEKTSYVFGCKKKQRPELAKIFGTEYINSGFTFKVKRKNLFPGKYRIGILIGKDGQIERFKFTDNYLTI